MKVIIEVDHSVSCDEIVEAFKDNPAVLSINMEGEHCGACTPNIKEPVAQSITNDKSEPTVICPYCDRKQRVHVVECCSCHRPISVNF